MFSFQRPNEDWWKILTVEFFAFLRTFEAKACDFFMFAHVLRLLWMKFFTRPLNYFPESSQGNSCTASDHLSVFKKSVNFFCSFVLFCHGTSWVTVGCESFLSFCRLFVMKNMKILGKFVVKFLKPDFIRKVSNFKTEEKHRKLQGQWKERLQVKLCLNLNHLKLCRHRRIPQEWKTVSFLRVHWKLCKCSSWMNLENSIEPERKLIHV